MRHELAAALGRERGLKMSNEFMEVPPPKVVPVNSEARALGLVHGLRPEKTPTQFRCAACAGMEAADSIMVWVPDGTRRGDPGWSVSERARQGAYNGGASGWCLNCARSLTPISASVKKSLHLLVKLFEAIWH